MIGSDTRDYRRDSGESLYRRSLYTFWKRAAPPASMDILSAPSREVCTVRRERTNTPLQALVTLNDPQFVEAARHLAQRTLKEGGQTAEERLTLMTRRLVARPLRPRGEPGGPGRARRPAAILPGTSGGSQGAAGRGRIEAGPGVRCSPAGRLDDAGQSVDESGRSAE